MHLDGLNATNHLDISNLFASRFQKNYVPDFTSGNTSNLDHILRRFDIISDISLTENEIFKVLLNLNPNKGAGPDDIPPAFLINCAESLVKPLHFIFNRSLATGIFPSKWKKSFSTPIYKSGS
jgi:hypothetical protein